MIVGGDQGLLNTFFPAYHRLSFTYNVTPSANYQYAPAYRHFSSNISLFHFIGRSKPWSQRPVSGRGSFSDATGRWWSVYEKHFGWKIREEELKKSQERALNRGYDGPPQSPFVEPYQYSSPVQYESGPSTADREKEQEELKKRQETALRIGRDGPPRPQSAGSYQYSSPVQYESRPSTADRARKEEELKKSQEMPLRRGRDGPPRPQSYQYSSPAQYESRPSTADRTEKEVSFSSTDTTFFHPSAPTPELPSSSHQDSIPHREPSPSRAPFESPESPTPSYHVFIPHREPSPPRKPFEPTMVTWDPARSAPPSDSGPEAIGLSISSYESAWDKPFNRDEPKWVPPPTNPLPTGYEYTPPPPPPPSESHDTSSDSEEETAEPGGYHTSDSESPDDQKEHPTKRYTPIFPWEMRGQRQSATRVFPGDEPIKDKGKAVEAQPYDRRGSFEKYEFINAYGQQSIFLISRWDSLPIIQSYVKQKLGETPAPSSAEAKPKVEYPSIPSAANRGLATSSVVSVSEGERWDPNKQLDKLKSGVISKLREQQRRSPTSPPMRSPGTTTEAGEEPPPKISVDDGTNPWTKLFVFFFFFLFVSAYNEVSSSKTFRDRKCYRPRLDEFKCFAYGADSGQCMMELHGRTDFKPNMCAKIFYSLFLCLSSLLFLIFRACICIMVDMYHSSYLVSRLRKVVYYADLRRLMQTVIIFLISPVLKLKPYALHWIIHAGWPVP